MVNYLETDSGRVMLDRYLSAKSAASRKVYKSEIVQFFGWLTGTGAGIEGVDGPVMDLYRQCCEEKKASPASIKRKFSMISGFMKLVEAETKGRVKAPAQTLMVRQTTAPAVPVVETEAFGDMLAGFRGMLDTRNSRASYTNAVRLFFQQVNKQPGAVQTADLMNWKIYLTRMEKKRTTIRAYFAGLKAFSKYLKMRNDGQSFEIDLSSLSLKNPDKKSKRATLLRSEMASMLSAMKDKGDLLSLRDFALFKMVYEQGLRISEAANFRVRDILNTGETADGEKAEIIIRDRKWGDSTAMILEAETLGSIREWMQASGYSYTPDSPVFLPIIWINGRYEVADHARKKRPLSTSTIQRRFHVWLRRAGINSNGKILNCHSIRHSRATHMAEAGAPIFALMKFLGHRNIKTTQLYLHSIEQRFEKHTGLYR